MAAFCGALVPSDCASRTTSPQRSSTSVGRPAVQSSAMLERACVSMRSCKHMPQLEQTEVFKDLLMRLAGRW